MPNVHTTARAHLRRCNDPVVSAHVGPLKHAIDFARGEAGPGFGVHILETIDVARIRADLGMSQREFAARFGFSINTLRHWEQGRRQPEGSSRAYLLVIRWAPDAVQQALRAA